MSESSRHKESNQSKRQESSLHPSHDLGSDFDTWASAVKKQMIASLQRRGAR
jgi:hypothetical protein